MYRIGIIGGETHINEITQLRGKMVEITGVAVRPDQVEWAKKEFGAPVYTDYRRLLDEKPIDIVAVANENDLKAEVMLESLRRGKHAIVDKPMALKLSEVEAIERLAKEKGLRVLMLLTMRGSPWYRKTREIVLSGAIGAPVQVYGKMQVPLKPSERPPWFLDKYRAGGPILDLALHTFDQVEWVTGLNLTAVTAYEANLSHPEMKNLIDSGAELFRLENGGTAFVEQNRVGFDYDYRLYVVGTNGQVNLLNNRSIRVQTQEGWREYGKADLGPTVSVVEDWLKSFNGG
ncbi:MAG: Gfo/Idh/MocA family oxidoreductase, partial [Anaerolineae bacterium]|nr:Gfo/Idh/MocA family oxidoreductase [Anaerolineae bacterium]